MKKLILLWLAAATVALAQQVTPNIGLVIQTPPQMPNNWSAIVNYDLVKIDGAFAGFGSQFKGAWSSSTTYAAGNVVQYVGQLYMSIQSSNLNQNPVSQTTYWTQISNTGVASLQSLTGDLHLESLDSSVNITTPDSTHINLQATGSGGVQYNPTTTAYIVASFSGLYDDGDADNSRTLPTISSFSCSGSAPSICTVNFATAHALSVGGAIDMHSTTGWPYSATQEAQHGSFQVTTVPSSTQITFSTPTSLSASCSSSCGTAYDATYWAIWQFAAQPFIYGHGTVYGIETPSSNLAANFTSLTSGITGTPKFLIDQTGQNDLSSGSTVSNVESYHQTIWAAAHTAGMTVVQTTLVPAWYGIIGIGSNAGPLNYWYWQQYKAPSNLSSGKYFDIYVDTATALMANTPVNKVPDSASAAVFATTLNTAFSTKSSPTIGPPINFTYSNSGLAGDFQSHWIGAVTEYFDDTWKGFMVLTENAVDLYSNYGQSNLRSWNSNLTSGNAWCSHGWGHDGGSSTDSFFQCFYYAGQGSTGNYTYLQTTGGLVVAKYFATGAIQFPYIVASSGLAAVCVDTAGNVQVGACGGTTSSALTMNNSGTGAASGSTFNGSSSVTISYNSLGAAPTASPTLTGVVNASGATKTKLASVAGYTSTTLGEVGYDTTNNNWHAQINGADYILVPLASGFTSGHCGQPTLSGTVWTIQDAGGACGVSGGGTSFGTLSSGDNTTATMTVDSGASIVRAGAGVIDANKVNAATIPVSAALVGTNSSGQFVSSTSSSGMTAGYIPLAGSATTITGNSHLDDGVTTASTITSTEPLAIGGSTHGLIIPAGTAVSGAANNVTIASDSTNGYLEANENNTGYSRVCTVANGLCASGSGNYVNLCSLVTLTNATCSSGQIVGTGTPASITISAIPGTYANLVLTVWGEGNDLKCNFNGDSGSNYDWMHQYNYTTSTGLSGEGAAGAATMRCMSIGSNGSGLSAGHGVMSIPGYADTTVYKSFSSTGSFNNGTAFYLGQYGGDWKSTSAITSITIAPNTGGNFGTVRMTLYGTN